MKLATVPYHCTICKQTIKGYERFARHVMIQHPKQARKARNAQC